MSTTKTPLESTVSPQTTPEPSEAAQKSSGGIQSDSGASESVSRTREAIEKSGLTQTVISERLGMPQSALSKHLYGYPMGEKRKARLAAWAEEVLRGQ